MIFLSKMYIFDTQVSLVILLRRITGLVKGEFFTDKIIDIVFISFRIVTNTRSDRKLFLILKFKLFILFKKRTNIILIIRFKLYVL